MYDFLAGIYSTTIYFDFHKKLCISQNLFTFFNSYLLIFFIFTGAKIGKCAKQ